MPAHPAKEIHMTPRHGWKPVSLADDEEDDDEGGDEDEDDDE
jgi:hypothetical protein